MNGTNALDGTTLSGIDHLRQSIRDILTTPKGSRVMRREYGSNIFYLIDRPMNRGTISQLRAEAVDALDKQEPRINVSAIKVVSVLPGQVVFDIEGTYLPDGQPIKLEGVIVK